MLSHGAASAAAALQPKRRLFRSHPPPLSYHFLGLSLLFHSWHQQSSGTLNLPLGRTWIRVLRRLCRMVALPQQMALAPSAWTTQPALMPASTPSASAAPGNGPPQSCLPALPFRHVLHGVRADEDHRENVAGLFSHEQRTMAGQRVCSRSAQWSYHLCPRHNNNELIAGSRDLWRGAEGSGVMQLQGPPTPAHDQLQGSAWPARLMGPSSATTCWH